MASITSSATPARLDNYICGPLPKELSEVGLKLLGPERLQISAKTSNWAKSKLGFLKGGSNPEPADWEIFDAGLKRGVSGGYEYMVLVEAKRGLLLWIWAVLQNTQKTTVRVDVRTHGTETGSNIEVNSEMGEMSKRNLWLIYGVIVLGIAIAFVIATPASIIVTLPFGIFGALVMRSLFARQIKGARVAMGHIVTRLERGGGES